VTAYRQIYSVEANLLLLIQFLCECVCDQFLCLLKPKFH